MQEKTYRKLHLPLHICPFYLEKLEPLDAHICKEWPGKIIYLNFDSIFGDFFLKFFEEEVSDYLS